jgi:hypothetical protein
VIRGAKRFLEVRRTILADRQQAIRQAGAQLAAYPVEPLANGHCDGSRHALPGECRQLLRQAVRLLVFDV